MKVIDLDLLIYAVVESSVHHTTLLPYWQRLLNGQESIGLPWVVLVGFPRITPPRTGFRNAVDRRGSVRDGGRTA